MISHERATLEMRHLQRHAARVGAVMLLAEPNPAYPEWGELTIGDALMRITGAMPRGREELVKTWLRHGTPENPRFIDQWRRIKDLKVSEKTLIANRLVAFAKGGPK